jgi:TPR repeat protein
MFPSMNSTHCLLASALLTLAISVSATPVSDAQTALQGKDPAAAIRILEQAAKAGDQAAKGTLASYLRAMPAPYRDVERACALALEAANAGDPTGAVTRAECLITGAVKAEQPWTQARALAHQGRAAHIPSAGFAQYAAFAMDPQYVYNGEGRPDKARYDALAALPLSARADQIEAYNGLSEAMNLGLVNAFMAALGYLLETSAPGNVKRALGVANVLQRTGNQIPEPMMPGLRMGSEALKLGTTHASPAAFSDAMRSVLTTAAAKVSVMNNTPCAAADIKPKRLVASEVQHPVYLPIQKGPLSDTYLVSGQWTETWSISACGKDMDVQVAFSADGWGGAKFMATLPAEGGEPVTK